MLLPGCHHVPSPDSTTLTPFLPEFGGCLRIRFQVALTAKNSLWCCDVHYWGDSTNPGELPVTETGTVLNLWEASREMEDGRIHCKFYILQSLDDFVGRSRHSCAHTHTGRYTVDSCHPWWFWGLKLNASYLCIFRVPYCSEQGNGSGKDGQFSAPNDHSMTLLERVASVHSLTRRNLGCSHGP